MIRSSWILGALALSITACGGGASSGEAADEGTDTSGGELSQQEPCVAFFTRQRECADAFLPELVALRVRLDRPAGIAEQDASEGRDALLAEARSEYANDSTDGAIAAQCQAIMGAPDAEQAAGGFASCLEQRECGAFVQCDLAMLEQHWASGGE